MCLYIYRVLVFCYFYRGCGKGMYLIFVVFVVYVYLVSNFWFKSDFVFYLKWFIRYSVFVGFFGFFLCGCYYIGVSCLLDNVRVKLNNDVWWFMI